jgi:hypothetical protein
MRTWSEILDHYAEHHRRDQQDELDYFRACRSLRDVVSDAALARLNGTKLQHQWRRPEHVLSASRDALLNDLPALRRAKRFDQLHETVEAASGSIKGIGPLTVYDTALRIGAWRGLLPTKVYLHAGTRTGAKNLGLAWRQPSLEMEVLPLPLQALPAHQVEDVLCIYKDVFGVEMKLGDSVACGRRVRRTGGSCRRGHRLKRAA